MAEGYFPFKVGELDCVSLCDGYHEYPIDSVFANVDPNHLEAALRARDLPVDRFPSPYASLYVDTGEHRVLIDSGAGHLLPTTGRLPAHLRQAGLDPAQIDMIVITHAHPDHIGGLLDEDGTPVYPNARLYTTETEWDFWLADDALDKAPGFDLTVDVAHRVFDALGRRFTYVQPDAELVPGIRLLQAFGHTAGHLAVKVSSASESLIYISDAILHPLHIENPDWLPDARYIRDLEQFQETARRLLARAVAKKALVLGMHFPPFPCLGHIIETDGGLRWKPVPALG